MAIRADKIAFSDLLKDYILRIAGHRRQVLKLLSTNMIKVHHAGRISIFTIDTRARLKLVHPSASSGPNTGPKDFNFVFIGFAPARRIVDVSLSVLLVILLVGHLLNRLSGLGWAYFAYGLTFHLVV